ncbi:Very-long-chain 3-oxoacyl-CoA reductase [Hypsibius exemplaris]|uniref:Very-long-chain 3-oxoacyl-CoA reductase n=1 Tax=Hypsibius exemplaris TaxID=2072580 RepID=A0A1W0WHJ9_HYPEX|nr:Very-long-chain 3-oxoacyl-CoA reductase [Hypsibius exemplaris]
MSGFWTELMPKCPYTFLVNVGTFVAALFFVKALYFFAKNFFVFFLAEPLGLTTNFRKLGEWAVVTGATFGIGKAYALDLARRGCNVVLISRSEDKLRAVAKEIEKTYPGTKTKIIVADFTAGDDFYGRIKDELKGLEIGTLINNVGMMYPYPEQFTELPNGDTLCLDLIRCNMVAQTLMTRIVLPQMVARHKGVVVGLSSGAGTMAVPLIALYSATKAYNDFFSRTLEIEYHGQGIIFQSITPFVVATQMSGNPTANMFIIDATKYARSCLNSVGFFSRSHGHPSHALQNWAIGRIPSFVRELMSLSFMNKGRAEVLKRQQKQNELKSN